MKFKKIKGADKVGDALGKVADVGVGAAKIAKSGAVGLVKKAVEEREKSLRKKLNPVFLEQYQMQGFNTPNMIMIVDDAVRKDIAYCEGAIGWRSTVKGMEVFHLYDEDIQTSQLTFIPTATCDTVYYVDPNDRNRYINLELYFDTMQESKLAELQHIAFSLGAKRYSVEMFDSHKKSESGKHSATALVNKAGGKVDASEEQSFSQSSQSKKKSLANASFSGERKPTHPNLRWFIHDDNIRNLIAMRLQEDGSSTITSYSIELKGSRFSSMSATTAAKIDAAVGKLASGKSSLNLQKKANEEINHSMVYRIEF